MNNPPAMNEMCPQMSRDPQLSLDTEPDNKQTSDGGQPEQTPIPGHIRYKTPIKSQIKKIKHSLFLHPRTN